jgi:uncharacterized RDD family membrane protein YckC
LTDEDLPAAGFWRRYVAYAIDSLVFMPLVAIALSPLDLAFEAWGDALLKAAPTPEAAQDLNARLELGGMLLGLLLGQVVMAVPMALCLATRWRATPGKALFGLCVVDDDLQRPGFGRALARELGKLPAGLALGLGIWAIAWRKDHRAWYDRWSGTRVMKRWPLATLMRHRSESL